MGEEGYKPPSQEERREALAKLCHEQWSGWMEYLFEKCNEGGEGDYQDGQIVMPAWAVERWSRQMKTPYEELSEKEKESDRKEADRFLELLEELEPPLWYKLGLDERSITEGD